MGLIKKPSELSVKETITAMIYGQPGIGKSTLACSAPNPVLFDYDGGVNRMNGAHKVPTVQITKWEETEEALKELEGMPECETIIIDTAGKMLAYMEQYIRQNNASAINKDGSFSLKGYGVRKKMFVDFLNRVSLMGKNIVFVAHEVEAKRGDDIIIRPEIGGSSANDLIKELDLVGYMEANGKNRTISFDPCDRYYAKNTCNMYGVIKIPVVVDDNGNATGSNSFFTQVVDAFKQRQTVDKEKTSEYEDLIELIRSAAEGIKDAESANGFITFVQGLQQVYNSKAVAGKMLQDKAAELGLKYNKVTKLYETA